MKKEYKLQNGQTAVFEYDENGIGKITVEAMDCLIDMLPKWIPCSEEEPPFGIEVLITRKGTVRLAERSIFDKEYPWYIHGHHSYYAKTVDAWMKLPEPYEVSENG